MRWLMRFFLFRISPASGLYHLWLQQQTHNALNFDHFTLGSGCGILLQSTLLCACGWLHGGYTYNKDTTYVYSQQSDMVSIVVHVLYVCTYVHICHTFRGCIVILYITLGAVRICNILYINRSWLKCTIPYRARTKTKAQCSTVSI